MQYFVRTHTMQIHLHNHITKYAYTVHFHKFGFDFMVSSQLHTLSPYYLSHFLNFDCLLLLRIKSGW